MKINQREKLLSGVLLITAVIVWMVSGGGAGETPGETQTQLVSSGRIFEQYRRIRPLPELEGAKQPDKTMSQRNIFQFGSRTVPVGEGFGTEALPGDGNEALMNGKNDKTGEEKKISGEPPEPQPPDIDFQVAGIILAGPAHAAVITRSPELFVVRESQQFLKHFILKSVKRGGIVIGYTDFKDELFIPLKKDGGLQ